MPAIASSKANADVAELHQSLRYMLKKWRDSRQELKIKPSSDPFNDYLSAVETRLCEMQLWDEILLEITDRPGLCSGQPALITLLKALRSQIADLTSAVALLTSEAKNRASFDWTLEELAKKKASIKAQTSEALVKLQEQVHREALKAERWSSYVAKIQDSMTATIDKVAFGTNSFPEIESVGQIESDNSFRELKQPMFPKLFDDSQIPLSSPSRSVMTTKSPQGEEIIVTSLSNGDRIVSSLTSGSAYYCFEMSEAAGLSITITQSPAGDSSNFIQILIARGSIPTSLAHSYHIRTRQTKHGFLQLSPEQVASGIWYIKVTGIGIKMKKYSLEVRMTMGLKKEVTDQSKLLDDIVNEIESQKTLTNRLNALENASAKTTQTIINAINSRNSCCNVAIQTTLSSELAQPQLSSQKPIAVKSQWGYFAQLFSLPVPDSKGLRRSSLRSTLRLILNIYIEWLNRAVTDEGNDSFCQFVYRLHMKRCNIVKQAETTLAELLNGIKTRRWLHIPRIQMFGRLCGLICVGNESSLDNHDAEFVLSVLSTMKRVVDGSTVNHNRHLDDVDGHIKLQRTVALQILDAIFVNDTVAFKNNVLKLALARTSELSKGKPRSGELVDGDALIEVVHRQWKDEKIVSDHHLKQLFAELDCDQTGWLDFARFVTAWNLITAVELGPSLTLRQPGYCSMDLLNIYKQMMEKSSYSQNNPVRSITDESNRDFAIKMESFLSVCDSFGLMTKRYVESRISTDTMTSQNPITDDGSTRKQIQPLLGRTVSLGTISLQDGTSTSYANNWTQMINDWKKFEQLIVHEINNIRHCKFLGHNEVWHSLNKFRSELRLRRDLGAALMSYRHLMDTIVKVLNESPLMPYRSIKQADELNLSEEAE